MASIRFYPLDHNYVGISGDRDILYELRAKYSFYAPNYKWDKRYKMGYWDGKISLINIKDGKFYAGLLDNVRKYLDEEKIDYIDDTDLVVGRELTNDQVDDFYQKIKGPFVPHEPQNLAFQDCVQRGRNIILAPTSNGKSYIIHGLNAYYKFAKKRVLLVIDRAQLVLQLKSNFVDEYGSDEFYKVSTVYDNNIGKPDVFITTWQSIVDYPDSWFKQFDVLIGDEVHKFKAKSLIELMKKCGHVMYRHGFTATLDNDSKTDALTLEGLFGPPLQTITLKEQIEQGISARPIIYVVMLKYSMQDRLELIKSIKDGKKQAILQGKKNVEALGFQIESSFLETHPKRLDIIAKLVRAQKGNTLVAFKNHEHGKSIYDHLQDKVNCDLFFANSTVKKEKRFEIQKLIEKLKESVAVVSFGTFSTGINITNLNNLIIGSQVKSSITVPQLIGRMIRLSKGKTTANVIDICDDLSHNGNKNLFYNHFEQRVKYYQKNGFEIKVKVLSLG